MVEVTGDEDPTGHTPQVLEDQHQVVVHRTDPPVPRPQQIPDLVVRKRNFASITQK